MDGISVIVCCYNSASRLPETIKHLAFQKISPAIKWEVIVVDNGSTDGTTEVALLHRAKYETGNFTFKVIEELEVGLSNARQKGVSEATFECLIFCDDDNWLSEDYIQTAYNIIKENGKIGVLGGRSEAISNSAFPSWFCYYQSAYAVGKQAVASGGISARGHVWGAGMTFKKSVYLKLTSAGFRFILSDRKGNEITSGGDSEICKWFLIAGYELWYDERLFFKHFIPSSRLTVNYRDSLISSFNKADEQLLPYQYYINNRGINDPLLKKTLSFFYSLLLYACRHNRYRKLCIANVLPMTLLKYWDKKYYEVVRIAKNIQL